jgi:hypothetical protein
MGHLSLLAQYFLPLYAHALAKPRAYALLDSSKAMNDVAISKTQTGY